MLAYWTNGGDIDGRTLDVYALEIDAVYAADQAIVDQDHLLRHRMARLDFVSWLNELSVV